MDFPSNAGIGNRGTDAVDLREKGTSETGCLFLLLGQCAGNLQHLTDESVELGRAHRLGVRVLTLAVHVLAGVVVDVIEIM
jgi:hypothetical protein